MSRAALSLRKAKRTSANSPRTGRSACSNAFWLTSRCSGGTRRTSNWPLATSVAPEASSPPAVLKTNITCGCWRSFAAICCRVRSVCARGVPGGRETSMRLRLVSLTGMKPEGSNGTRAKEASRKTAAITRLLRRCASAHSSRRR
ncbi:hypothetical protein D3C79_586160 [compost metagenome]